MEGYRKVAGQSLIGQKTKCLHCGASALEFVNSKGFHPVPGAGDELHCKECGGVVRQTGPSSEAAEYKCNGCSLVYVHSLRTYHCEDCGGFTEETSVNLIRPDGTQSESSVWSAA